LFGCCCGCGSVFPTWVAASVILLVVDLKVRKQYQIRKIVVPVVSIFLEGN
jgi:hypothetical protein